jgi:hypothetical protein
MRKFDWVAMPSRPNTVAVRWLRAVHGSVPEVEALEMDSRLMNHVLDRTRRRATTTPRIVVVEILMRISSRGVSIRATPSLTVRTFGPIAGGTKVGF